MKFRNQATAGQTQNHAQRGLRNLYGLFLGFLLCQAGSVAAASPLPEVLVLKGAKATPNNALLSPYRVLNSTDGLPQNTVYAMANGPDGRIYVGT